MPGKDKTHSVYCPRCGETADSGLLYCPHCGESLHNAAPADPGEHRRKQRRLKRARRAEKSRLRREKREALFERLPILRPLYYCAFAAVIICVPLVLWRIYMLSRLAGAVIVSALFITFYCWYVPILTDNIDLIIDSVIPREMPFRYRNTRWLRDLIWGCVVTGGMLIILLLSWVYECLP